MPHISLPEGLPGIRGSMAFRPETAKPLNELADVRARQHGATDLEIHDTVLIAAAFCMFNRYVEGLGTWAPDDPDFYRARAALVAEHGYASATLLR